MTALRPCRLGAALIAVALTLAGLPLASAAPAMPAFDRVARNVNCQGATTGLTPLPDLGREAYQGFEGGLYPDGKNVPPTTYFTAGLERADQIQPLDVEGQPDSGGRIALLSLGMSNTTREFSGFIRLATADDRMNPQLTIVDGAQGGQDALDTSDPAARFWSVVDARLAVADVTPAQVQVIWLKQAIAREDRPFPEDARALQDALTEIVDIAAERFPNLQIVYLSSRTYAGYATTRLNPEPIAYASGFAVKWLIEERIDGASDGPWLAWGPYLWTDGASGRSDGLTWTCQDVAQDGTHPSPAGVDKVAQLLLDFFAADPTASPWFIGNGA